MGAGFQGANKMTTLKQMAALLPERWQSELKRLHYGRQIARGNFLTGEPEYRMLQQLLQAGDWVIDIGANVGHYTKKLSDIVGPMGRVIAFEPVPATFALLAANAQRFRNSNVTLINAAVSAGFDVVRMSIPQFASGLTNYYEAEVSASDNNGLAVLSVSIDSLSINHRIKLVKVDTEGHEAYVVAGMRHVIAAHHPVLIIETRSTELVSEICAMGYTDERLPRSPNVLFWPAGLNVATPSTE